MAISGGKGNFVPLANTAFIRLHSSKWGASKMKYDSRQSRVGPKLTAIATCIVVGLAAGSAQSVGTTSTYLAAPARTSQDQREGATAKTGRQLRHNQATARAEKQAALQQRRAQPNRWQSSNRTLISSSAAPARPAAVITVANCDDSGAGSLRQAMVDAVDGDTIDLTGLECGTILLTSGSLVSHGGLELLGPGRDQLTIDGNANGLVLNHEAGVLEISGLTLTNGRTTNGFGGCVSVYGGLSLVDSRVTGCVAGDGTNQRAYGAGLDVYGSLYLVNSIVSGNTAISSSQVDGSDTHQGGSYGGGIYAGGDVYLMYGNEISGNTATSHAGGEARGGGVFSQGSVAVVQGVVADNQASSIGVTPSHGYGGTAYGGGIHANGYGVVVFQSTISGNTAYSEKRWSYGGGVQLKEYGDDDTGHLFLIASTVSGNTVRSGCEGCFIMGGGAAAFGHIAAVYSTINDNSAISAAEFNGVSYGGGLALYGLGSVVVQSSTISSNRAIGGTGGDGGDGWGAGGGVFAVGYNVNVVNATVTLNTASHASGGIAGYTEDDELVNELHSSIIANNQAPVDPDIGSPWGASFPLSFTGSHNLVTVAGASTNLPPDTINDDPQLQPLAMNGGPTATHALLVDSPAIDAGINPGGPDSDQRGSPFVREWGAAPDIGAFELQPDPYLIFKDGFEN